MKSFLVSILIPSYNSENYIEETLSALLNQSYTNWECVIVDDHSTDQSFELIEKFISKNGQNYTFKLFKNIRKGACAARNFAFEQSKGAYIQYLDADDQLTNNKLENQLALLTNKTNAIANCKWGKFQGSIENVKWSNQFINKNYDDPSEWLIDSWLGKGMAQTSTWLTPRHLIEKAGVWDESLRINQDGDFFCKVLLESESILFCEESGVYYRFGSSESISQKNVQSEEKASSLLKSYINYECVLNVRNDLQIRKALACNFIDFIYRYYSFFPLLIMEAENHFYALGFKKMWSSGGKNFKQLAKIIGFKNALRLKAFIKKIW